MSNSKRDLDHISGVETTGHEWDGITELNNPLPRWWLMTFYACIVFALGYTVVYPAWPGLTGNTKGVWGWSSRGDIEETMTGVADSRKAVEAKIAAADMAAVMADPEMKAFAVSAGASAFKVRCAACHGSGAQGAVGFPNLNDDDWVWGGKPEQIVATIAHGVRAAGDNTTRQSQMPAFGGGVLNPQQINQVANYVWSLSGGKPEDESAAKAGQQVYVDNCAACHGDQAQGNQDLGAPKLSDQIWLYKGSVADIAAQINNPKHGVMPAWEPLLGPVLVKELAVYVVSLGGSK
jgi:cytochrome c oxidase cbb3-type subunit 3